MHWLDLVVLVGYFVVMIGIGVYSVLRIKAQEDFFMGGRSFGKLLQTFAAFGAGTGSSDPVATGRTTFTSGMSGMWSVMSWLFVTPFYWITGVWYRRMRLLTLGDWFVERYESRAMGAAYCIFGLTFFAVYGSMFFSAIGKVAVPLMEIEAFTWGNQQYQIEYLLVPIIGVVVLVYGIAGGLRAAYYTDLIQGICIILLSIMLVPFGLNALVREFGTPDQGMWDGFAIMHQQLPEDYFNIVGSTTASDFPLHRIVAVVLISLMGIVVQPHFIATGGGSAKTETNARVGLVVGNFLKRFCTIGWVLTALIALVLFADRPELLADADKTWGIASRELLGPGLTGLMLACLLAALMSSVDAYMIVGSGLMVRNLYAAYVKPHASEKEYLLVARLTGVLVVGGAVVISLFMMDVFQQLQLTWVFPVLFAAPFWVGMYWRRATTTAAWTTVGFCLLMFFVIPYFAPLVVPGLRTNPRFLVVTDVVQTISQRPASRYDVARRQSQIRTWDATDAETRQRLGPRPEPLTEGETFETISAPTGGQGVFFPGGVKAIDAQGKVLENVQPAEVRREQVDQNTTRVILRYDEYVPRLGMGNFRLDFLLYRVLGITLRDKSDATLSTMELGPKMVTPFLVMILMSLITRPNSREALDRYYVKMKLPVDPDPDVDHRQLEEAYRNPQSLDHRKLFPGSNLEFQRPTVTDAVGFVTCIAVCFGIIGLAVAVATIGS